jgi:hypothetical protein
MQVQFGGPQAPPPPPPVSIVALSLTTMPAPAAPVGGQSQPDRVVSVPLMRADVPPIDVAFREVIGPMILKSGVASRTMRLSRFVARLSTLPPPWVAVAVTQNVVGDTRVN